MLSKNPSLHHPRAAVLGLTNEKIVLLSANSIRATVATENNKVGSVWFASMNIYFMVKVVACFSAPFSFFHSDTGPYLKRFNIYNNSVS